MSKEIQSNPVKTILVICVGFAVIGTFADQKWALYVAISVGAIGFLSPWVAEKIEWVWFAIAKIMSYIVPNVLLTAVFYLALFPMSLLAKAFKKDDALKLKDKYDSMYVTVEQEITKESFERPF